MIPSLPPSLPHASVSFAFQGRLSRESAYDGAKRTIFAPLENQRQESLSRALPASLFTSPSDTCVVLFLLMPDLERPPCVVRRHRIRGRLVYGTLLAAPHPHPQHRVSGCCLPPHLFADVVAPTPTAPSPTPTTPTSPTPTSSPTPVMTIPSSCDGPVPTFRYAASTGLVGKGRLCEYIV